MSSDEALKGVVVHETRDDWLDLFHAIALVKIVEGGEDRLRLLGRVGPLVVELVREGRLVCGEPANGPIGFEPWALDPDAAANALREYIDRALAREIVLVPWEPCGFARPEQLAEPASSAE